MSLSGTDFEALIKPFFRTVFEKMGFTVLEVRNQTAGTQNGFDIYINFLDFSTISRHFFIECKYYTSQLSYSEILNKQYQLFDSFDKIDAFIALSPVVNLSNINHKLKTNADHRYGFPVDFWSPDRGIRDLFTIDSVLYEKVYGEKIVGEINEDLQINNIKGLVVKLIQDKDSTVKPLPQKKAFTFDQTYIPRRIVDTMQSDGDFYGQEGNSLHALFKTEKKIALIGWAATGKSTEINKLLNLLSSPDQVYYPFLIKLNIHIEAPIKDSIPEINDIPQNLIVLCLDGLDEVQPGSFESVTRRIQEFVNEFPEARVIVSCRSNFYTTNLKNSSHNTLKEFKSFYLSNLSYRDVRIYVDSKFPLLADSFLNEVQDKGLENLMHIPYYLIKLSDQYQKSNQISNSKAELFESIIKENIENDIVRYFPNDRTAKEVQIRKLLEKLAFILEFQGKNICTSSELNTIFTATEIALIQRAGSLIQSNDEPDASWGFNHNNTQEYLAAKVISALGIDDILKTVAFAPKFQKIKPSWVNTLAFLIGILDEGNTKEKLLNILIENEPELLIKFEPDKLDVSKRIKVFQKVFNYYKSRKRWINRSKFVARELARFSRNEATLKFLISELKKGQPPIGISNALDLIGHFDVQNAFSNYATEVKKLLEDLLYLHNIEEKYLPIRVYLDLFKLTFDEFDKLMSEFSNSDNTWIRHTIYQGIHTQKFQDRYIDFVLQQILLRLKNELNDSNALSNESSDLHECAKTVIEKSSLLKILDFIIDNYGKISYSVYFTELVQDTLANITSLFPADDDLFEKVKESFNSESNIRGDKIDKFIAFFDFKKARLVIFKEIYNFSIENLNYGAMSKLTSLANEECVTFLANEFAVGKINAEIVRIFQYQITGNPALLEQFNILVNAVEKIELPTLRDRDAERRERNQQTLNVLFNKDNLRIAISQLFEDAGKEELTYDEIREIHKTEWEGKYLPIVYHTTRIFNKDVVRTKTGVLEYVDRNWPAFSIKHIITFLRSNENVILNETQLGYIREWCDEEIKKVDFKNAISAPEANVTRADKSAIKISYLIRKLNLTHYSQDLYLNFLSFSKWDDKEVEIFDFVKTVVPKTEIDQRVHQNISNGIIYYQVLENHLSYAVNNTLTEIAPKLIQYLTDNDNQRYHVLDCFVKLNGDLELLEQILPAINDDFKLEIIKHLMYKDRPFVKKHLLKLFNRETDSDKKLRLAALLIQLQNINGLNFYIKFAEEKKLVPELSSRRDPFGNVTEIKLLKKFFIMYELGYKPEIISDVFSNLKDIAISGIQSISLSGDNFVLAQKIFKRYRFIFNIKNKIKFHKKPDIIVQYLEHYFENIEQQYYINKSTKVHLSEAIKKYSALSFN